MGRLHWVLDVAAQVLPEEPGPDRSAGSSAAARLLAQVHDDRTSESTAMLMVADLTPELAFLAGRDFERETDKARRTRRRVRPRVVQDRQEAGRVRSDRGVFVVFEGGDGVGKTTQVDRLCGWLTERGYEVVRTFEPGDTAVGAAIRRIVLDPATGEMSPRAEALLYAADKAQHVYAVVEPALDRGAVVVCDRYVDSMLAYQGAGRVLAPAEVEQVARWATEDLRPHLTVVLDIEPGRARARQRPTRTGWRPPATGSTSGPGSSSSSSRRGSPEHYLVLDARRPGTRSPRRSWTGCSRCCRRRVAASIP